MFLRGALALGGLVLALFLAVGGRGPTTALAIPAGSCLDPNRGSPDFDNINRGNSVSVWNWTATNGSSGQFTAVQTHASPPFLDIVSIGGLLGEAWSGLGIGLGTSVWLIESPKSSSGFSFASLNVGPEEPFGGFALGGSFFIAGWTATSRVRCADNLVSVPSAEITDEDAVDEPDDPPVGWTARGFSPANDGVTCAPDVGSCLSSVVFSGSRSLRATTGTSDCGEFDPHGNYWVSPDLGLISGDDLVLGAFTMANLGSRARIGVLIRFAGIDIEYREAAFRDGTVWGLASGSVDLSDVALFFTSEHIVLHADFANCSGASGTAQAFFDDIFAYQP